MSLKLSICHPFRVWFSFYLNTIVISAFQALIPKGWQDYKAIDVLSFKTPKEWHLEYTNPNLMTLPFRIKILHHIPILVYLGFPCRSPLLVFKKALTLKNSFPLSWKSCSSLKLIYATAVKKRKNPLVTGSAFFCFLQKGIIMRKLCGEQ
jgi:hypothetical protein